MLDPDGALILARTASRTLPEHLFRYIWIRLQWRLDGNFRARSRHNGNCPFRPVVAQIPAHPENDFLRVEKFPGAIGRAVLSAAAALDAAECLQRHDIGNIFSGLDPKVLIAFERRD